MKYWMVVGTRNYDKLVVVCEVLKFKNDTALFESKKGDLVLALNKSLWSSIQPMTVDEYNATREPVFRQKG